MENSGLISPNLVTFLFTIVNIGVLFFILRLILFKPLTKFINNRAQKIQDSISQAESERKQAQDLLAQYKEQLKNAETEAGHIIKAARETAAYEADRIIAEGKNSAELLLDNARKQLAAEQAAAQLQFKTEAVMLVLAASSRLIGRDVQNNDNRHYVNMLMKELPYRTNLPQAAAGEEQESSRNSGTSQEE